MKRYVLWDKQSDIVTPGMDQNGKQRWGALEYVKKHAQWAMTSQGAIDPAVKIIVTDGRINGGVFMEFEATVEFYKHQIASHKLAAEEAGFEYDGPEITDGMTDEAILDAIEAVEDYRPPQPVSTEERTAAALEALVLVSM